MTNICVSDYYGIAFSFVSVISYIRRCTVLLECCRNVTRHSFITATELHYVSYFCLFVVYGAHHFLYALTDDLYHTLISANTSARSVKRSGLLLRCCTSDWHFGASVYECRRLHVLQAVDFYPTPFCSLQLDDENKCVVWH